MGYKRYRRHRYWDYVLDKYIYYSSDEEDGGRSQPRVSVNPTIPSNSPEGDFHLSDLFGTNPWDWASHYDGFYGWEDTSRTYPARVKLANSIAPIVPPLRGRPDSANISLTVIPSVAIGSFPNDNTPWSIQTTPLGVLPCPTCPPGESHYLTVPYTAGVTTNTLYVLVKIYDNDPSDIYFRHYPSTLISTVYAAEEFGEAVYAVTAQQNGTAAPQICAMDIVNDGTTQVSILMCVVPLSKDIAYSYTPMNITTTQTVNIPTYSGYYTNIYGNGRYEFMGAYSSRYTDSVTSASLPVSSFVVTLSGPTTTTGVGHVVYNS